MGRVIAITNQKGGVGKTTTTINLGAALAEKGIYTLLIDCDPQGTLSIGLGLPAYEVEFTLYGAIADRRFPIDASIHHARPHLDLVPANIDLASAELQLVATKRREFVLRDAIAPIRARYSYILIDCPPSLGLLTVNVLTAADEVLVPLKTDFLATRGLDALVDVIAQIRGQLNPNLSLLGIVPTMVNTRRAHSIKVLEQVRAKYPDKLLDVMIKDSASFPEAPDHHQTIFEIDKLSEGADEYRALAEWLIKTEQPSPVEQPGIDKEESKQN
jgi:chromosome partitioning protein